MTEYAINPLSGLSETEYADLARHGKVEFRIFCQKHNLPFHFPDVEPLDVNKAQKQSPLFWKALNLFNKANRERVYVVNGKPVTFVYSFGGLDLEYQAYDSKELLRAYFELQKKHTDLKEKNAFWIAICAIGIFVLAGLWLNNQVWLFFLIALPLGLFINCFINRQKDKKELNAKVEYENKIAELRRDLLGAQDENPDGKKS